MEGLRTTLSVGQVQHLSGHFGCVAKKSMGLGTNVEDLEDVHHHHHRFLGLQDNSPTSQKCPAAKAHALGGLRSGTAARGCPLAIGR